MKKIMMLIGLLCLGIYSCAITNSQSKTVISSQMSHEKNAKELSDYWADQKINLMATIVMSIGQAVELVDVGIVFTKDDFVAIISTEIRVGKEKGYAGTVNTIFVYGDKGWSTAGMIIKPPPGVQNKEGFGQNEVN